MKMFNILRCESYSFYGHLMSPRIAIQLYHILLFRIWFSCLFSWTTVDKMFLTIVPFKTHLFFTWNRPRVEFEVKMSRPKTNSIPAKYGKTVKTGRQWEWQSGPSLHLFSFLFSSFCFIHFPPSFFPPIIFNVILSFHLSFLFSYHPFSLSTLLPILPSFVPSFLPSFLPSFFPSPFPASFLSYHL